MTLTLETQIRVFVFFLNKFLLSIFIKNEPQDVSVKFPRNFSSSIRSKQMRGSKKFFFSRPLVFEIEAQVVSVCYGQVFFRVSVQRPAVNQSRHAVSR